MREGAAGESRGSRVAMLMAPRVWSRVERGRLESGEGGMGLGFGARGEMVWLENGDGGGDDDSLCFYVAITLPQMPLSESMAR